MMVGQVLKFDPKYQIMAQKIENGDFGEVTNMYLERSSTNGVPRRLSGAISMYHYMGVHDFEAMLTFAGSARPVKVYAQAVDKVNGAFNGDRAVNEGDATFNTITFDNGTIAVIHLSGRMPASLWDLWQERMSSARRQPAILTSRARALRSMKRTV